MPKLSPCLWFDNQAEEAAKFYASIFRDGKVGNITRYGKEGFEIHHKPEGSVLTVEFHALGTDFVALNGGPQFRFNESVSFQVVCDTQEEINYYWDKLSAGGDPNAQQCGWLKDKFGLSWQVVPSIVPKLLQSADAAKAGRVMNAIFQTKKFDIAALKRAAAG